MFKMIFRAILVGIILVVFCFWIPLALLIWAVHPC